MKDTMVMKHLNDWRNLRAWGRSLEEITITVSERRHPERLGTCWPMQGRLVVYQDLRTIDMLATGLHEMAHAVEMTDGHGAKWQARYAAAVTEVTGIHVVGGCDEAFEAVDRAGETAMRAWWKISGNEFAEKLLTRAR